MLVMIPDRWGTLYQNPLHCKGFWLFCVQCLISSVKYKQNKIKTQIAQLKGFKGSLYQHNNLAVIRKINVNGASADAARREVMGNHDGLLVKVFQFVLPIIPARAPKGEPS